MKHKMQTLNPKTPSDGFVLNSERGKTLGAIEGMSLSIRMESLLRQSKERGLSGDQSRALIRAEAKR